MRLIKISELSEESRNFLRNYWKKMWPPEYVDELLGKRKKSKPTRKARAHDRVIFKNNGVEVKGKVINIIQDKASVATQDFVHILPLKDLEIYRGD